MHDNTGIHAASVAAPLTYAAVTAADRLAIRIWDSADPLAYQRPLSALCSQWLTTWRMGEDTHCVIYPTQKSEAASTYFFGCSLTRVTSWVGLTKRSAMSNQISVVTI
jgi:hypothetical protein